MKFELVVYGQCTYNGYDCSLAIGTALFVFVGCSAGSSMDMGDDSNDVERGARIASIGK